MKSFDYWLKKIEEQDASGDLPLQDNIEAQMREIVNLGNYEAAYLYDQDGLLIAQCDGKLEKEEHKVIQISLMVRKMKEFVASMAKLSELREVMLEDVNGRKLIFRFITFFGQPAILVAVVPIHKAYRGLTNRLQRTISKLTFLED